VASLLNGPDLRTIRALEAKSNKWIARESALLARESELLDESRQLFPEDVVVLERDVKLEPGGNAPDTGLAARGVAMCPGASTRRAAGSSHG